MGEGGSGRSLLFARVIDEALANEADPCKAPGLQSEHSTKGLVASFYSHAEGIVMISESEGSVREYVGFIRIAGQPEIQLRLMASSSSEARAMVIEQYGEGHVISVWNEEDASRPR